MDVIGIVLLCWLSGALGFVLCALLSANKMKGYYDHEDCC